MDPLRTVCETEGFFTRPMAAELGYTTRSFDRVYQSGAWHRFRHGYYTFPDIWAGLDVFGKHRLRCRAVVHSMGSGVILSHVSSLVWQGIEPWDADLRRVHTTRHDHGAGRIEGDVAHHVAKVVEGDVVEIDGLRCTVADRAAMESATRVDAERALCLFNQVLHAGMCDEAQLFERFDWMARWPRTRHLHIPIRLADARCETVGESRGMWLFWSNGLPAPEPAYKIYDAAGTMRYICDWGWGQRNVYGEFDGKVKYGRLLRPGQQAGDVVFAEKQREDDIRDLTGGKMFRLTWVDYDRPHATVARIKRTLGLAA